MHVVLCLMFLLKMGSAELDWWERSVIYQIYPRSFKDSNGDGVGDLNGISEKLDYIKDLGVHAVWLQPVYKSPMVDMGYDPISMKEIDPLFGTMEDMKKLIKGLHDRGLKLLMDFIPNHVSDQSEWFKYSADRVEPYTDYFIWHDGKIINETHRAAPNNWACFFEDSPWTWNEKRGQYYYHLFFKNQPELNFWNPRVREEMEDVLRFWLDLGVDGFRVDAVANLIEAEHLKDEPYLPNSDSDALPWFRLNHTYTRRHPDNLELLHQWRRVLDEYKMKDGITRLYFLEDVSAPDYFDKYLGNETHPIAHFTSSFGLERDFNFESNAKDMDKIIYEMLDILPEGHPPNWMINSHDGPRKSTLFGAESVDAFNMLQLLLPGSAVVYYGAEIGLEDSMIRRDQRVDSSIIESRDVSRAPMIWDDTRNAGFTTNKKSWLPVYAGYWRKNVKRQLEEPNSHLKIFKRLMRLRESNSFKYGDFKTYIVSDWTYMISRTADNETIVLMMNIGSESERVCLSDTSVDLPHTMVVHTGSLNSGFRPGIPVETKQAPVETKGAPFKITGVPVGTKKIPNNELLKGRECTSSAQTMKNVLNCDPKQA